MKTRNLFFIPIFLLSIPLTSCGHTNKNKITIAEVTHSIFYAPQYIAINNGYFKEEGLDVELLSTPGADKTMAALFFETGDIGLRGSNPSRNDFNYALRNISILFSKILFKNNL